MRRFLRLVIMGIAVITFTAIFLTATEPTWDRASEHIVTADVYDMFGDYCHTYGYSYYVADTTTQHYKFYHKGPTVPNTPPYPHTGTLSGRYQHQTEERLTTLCDGSLPDVADSGSDS